MGIPAVAIHPAHVAYVRRRARNPVTAFARMATPVLLAQAERAAFDRPGSLPAGAAGWTPFEPWVRDGVVWQPLRSRGDGPGADGEAVTPAGFAAWLAGESRPGDGLTIGLDQALAGTPLCRRLEVVPYANHALDEYRGWPSFCEEEAREILWDERGEASEAAAAFARDEILIVEDAVLVRSHPRIRLLRGGKPPWELDATRGDRRRPGFAIDRPEEAEAALGRRVPEHGAIREARAMLSGLDLGDHDLRLACNALPRSFHDVVDPLARGAGTLSAEARASARAHRDALARLVRRGECGRIGPDGVGEALAAMMATAALARGPGRGVSQSHHVAALDEAVRYIQSVALPRLGAPVAGEDLEALSGLAP